MNRSRWSKLQKQLYDLISPQVDLQVHCGVYRMQSRYGRTGLPRYWITLEKKIIWGRLQSLKKKIGNKAAREVLMKRMQIHAADLPA